MTMLERNKLKIELYRSGISKERQREIVRMLSVDEEQSLLLDIRGEYGDEDF